MNKEAAKVRKVIDEVEEARTPFKMACWDKVEAKIKAAELEDHPADFYAHALKEKKAENAEKNSYIKNNKKALKNIENEWF